MAEVIVTDHVIYRLLERGIDVHEAKKVAKSGHIAKPDSCVKITSKGKSTNGRLLEVVSVKKDNKIIIITAYYGD